MKKSIYYNTGVPIHIKEDEEGNIYVPVDDIPRFLSALSESIEKERKIYPELNL